MLTKPMVRQECFNRGLIPPSQIVPLTFACINDNLRLSLYLGRAIYNHNSGSKNYSFGFTHLLLSKTNPLYSLVALQLFTASSLLLLSFPTALPLVSYQGSNS